MILNKDKKIEYIGKVLDLLKTSYTEIGSIYDIDKIDTFNAIAVDKKYKRVMEILEAMKTVVESGEFDQFNEAQIRVYYKNQNMFTLEVDYSLFQDFNLVNYFGIPTFDFIAIINSYIFNEAVVKIDSYAELLNSEEGKAQVKAAKEAQENARKQQSLANTLGNMSPEEVKKFMEAMGINNNVVNNPVIDRYGKSSKIAPVPAIENAEIAGQNLNPTAVKPVGSWENM